MRSVFILLGSKFCLEANIIISWHPPCVGPEAIKTNFTLWTGSIKSGKKSQEPGKLRHTEKFLFSSEFFNQRNLPTCSTPESLYSPQWWFQHLTSSLSTHLSSKRVCAQTCACMCARVCVHVWVCLRNREGEERDLLPQIVEFDSYENNLGKLFRMGLICLNESFINPWGKSFYSCGIHPHNEMSPLQLH